MGGHFADVVRSDSLLIYLEHLKRKKSLKVSGTKNAGTKPYIEGRTSNVIVLLKGFQRVPSFFSSQSFPLKFTKKLPEPANPRYHGVQLVMVEVDLVKSIDKSRSSCENEKKWWPGWGAPPVVWC